MAAISELLLLALSLGTLRSWQDDNLLEDAAYLENNAETAYGSRSLYDLMAHFPKDKDIRCPGSDSRFRYPGECTRYVTCRDYEAHIRSCPPGMSFDQNYKHCRLAFEVNCEEQPKKQQICSADEVYLDCGYEHTCSSSGEEDCKKGCFCDLGYVRDNSGRCVTEDACENENDLSSVIEIL